MSASDGKRLHRLWRFTLTPLLTLAGATTFGAPAASEAATPPRLDRHISKQRAVSKGSPRSTPTPVPHSPRSLAHGKQKASAPVAKRPTPSPSPLIVQTRASQASPAPRVTATLRPRPALNRAVAVIKKKPAQPIVKAPSPPNKKPPKLTANKPVNHLPQPHKRAIKHEYRPILVHSTAAPVSPSEDPLVIEELAWRRYGLVLQATKGFEPQVSILNNPHRMVLDIPNADFADTRLKQTIPVGSDGVEQIRVGEYAGGTRLVIDCSQSPNFQLMQLREHSVLIVARSGSQDPALTMMLRQFSAAGDDIDGPPPGQALKGLWARETENRLTLHVALDGPRVSLFQPSPDRLRIRIPGGSFSGKLPQPGRLLQKIEASQEGHTWVLDVTLTPGHYEVSERRDSQTGITLAWDRVDPRARPDMPLVVIDPGHGGNDPGALGTHGKTEKNVCLKLAHALRDALLRRGYNAILTRGIDAEMHLLPRVEVIKRWKGDMFVSLHANSHSSEEVHGLETYWREPGSQNFAQVVHQTVTTLLRRPDRGVKQDGLFVLRNGSIPSLLLETGFISNPTEARLLSDANFQAQTAFAIATGIEQFRLSPKELAHPGRWNLNTLKPSWAACVHSRENP